MKYLPIFLSAEKAGTVLVVGGGGVAAAKLEALAAVGAIAEVAAQEYEAPVVALCRANGFRLHRGGYSTELLKERKIVVAADKDDALNAQIAADCRARGVLVNVADNPPLCDFIFPALVRRGPLQIAISSSGVAPVLTRLIKQYIETLIVPGFEKLVSFLQARKNEIRAQLTNAQARRLFYEQIITGAVAEDIAEGNMRRAADGFAQALRTAPNEARAALYLVGAGPGATDLMTLKAARLLSRADVVLYDRLIPPHCIEQFARKEALKIAVGKTRDHHHKTQQDIDTLIETHLRAGRYVVRLKGGDPGIYAHGAEEIAVARKLGAPYQIVPGVSAANGCAAYAGVPLTERGGAVCVRFLALHSNRMEQQTLWDGLASAQDDTLVFYMSSRNYALLCRKLIEKKFDQDTPFLIVEQGATEYQRDYPGTLGAFDALYGGKKFASPCLMIVGAVTRWRDRHRWKEPAAPGGDYFTPLPQKDGSVFADGRQGTEI